MSAQADQAPSLAFLRNAQSTVVARLIERLRRHRLLLLVGTALYLAAVITLHDVMQRPAYWAQGTRGHRSWNNLVTACTVPLLAAFCLWTLWNLRRHARPWVASLFLAVTVALSITFFRTLLVMNIEVIHYPQYAILGVLLFALTGSFAQAIVWATFAGVVDEAYQYFYLYAGRGIHMDFNDVILNTVGAGFGLVALLVAGVHAPRVRFLRSPPFIATLTVAAGCVALYPAGLLRLLPAADASPWTIVLRRGGPSTMFWTPTTWGKTYHEVQPLEWVVVSVVLIAFYALLDRVRPARES